MGKRGCGKEERRGEETAVALQGANFLTERRTQHPGTTQTDTRPPDTTAAPPLLPAPGGASSTHPAPCSSPARPGQRRAAGTHRVPRAGTAGSRPRAQEPGRFAPHRATSTSRDVSCSQKPATSRARGGWG